MSLQEILMTDDVVTSIKNNLTYLEEKLMDMNKIGKRNSFFDKTKTNINISFQGGGKGTDTSFKLPNCPETNKFIF